MSRFDGKAFGGAMIINVGVSLFMLLLGLACGALVFPTFLKVLGAALLCGLVTFGVGTILSLWVAS